MAKNKKEMTPEERLAAALVPEEEQPYELPEGWKWVYGTGFFLPMETEYPTGDSFRYIDIESIDNSVQRVRCPKNLPVKKAPSRASRKLHIGDTLFSMVRPYLKNIAYIDEEYSDCIGSTGFYVCTPTPLVDRHYLYWLMVSPFVVNGLNHFMKGDNSPSIRKGDIEKFVYPIPPLSEQHRLVARIESLFAKLDAAKEKVQSVLDSHETRKAALLHDAFTGKLTAKWREEHQTELREIKQFPSKLKSAPNHVDALAGKWALVRLGDVITWSSGGTPSRKHPEYYSGDIPWVKTGELNNTYIYDTSEKITKEAIAQSSAKVLPVNTVLLAMYGATIGKVGILGVEAATNQACACGICSEWVDYRFLFYYLQSQKSSFICSGKGGAQPNISQTIIKQYEFPLPSLPEQQEIIRILGRLLAREQRARQAAEETLTAIDRMKQSILARAFRGEL